MSRQARRTAKFQLVGLVAAAVLFGPCPAQARQDVYVADISAASVTVLAADTGTVLAEIAVGRDPDAVAVSHDGAFAYVSNFSSDSVSVISTADRTVVATVAVGAGPVGLAVSPADDLVYVASKTAGTVSIVDTARRTVVASVAMGTDEGPNWLAVSRDGSRVYVTNSFRDSVAVIDTAARSVIQSISVGERPNRIALAPDGPRAYVTRFGTGSVAVLDLASATLVAEIPAAAAGGVAVSTDGRWVYVTGGSDLALIDAVRLEVARRLCIGANLYGVAVLADGHTVYAADMGRDEVQVVRDDPLRLAASIALRGGPYSLAVSPPLAAPVLDARILAPASGFKLDPAQTSGVRITVRSTGAGQLGWTLSLCSVAAPGNEVLLAEGTTAVEDAVVASLIGAALERGVPYGLILRAQEDGAPAVMHRVTFLVPDRRYTLVPLDPVRSGSSFVAQMDASGARFARWLADERAVEVRDVASGSRRAVPLPVAMETIPMLRLSGDGRFAAFSVPGLFGELDLENGVTELFPIAPDLFTTDAIGRWIGAFMRADDGWHYGLYDGVRRMYTQVTDQGNDTDIPPTCRPAAGSLPVVSGDGTTLVFATTLDLGVAGANGCNIFAYDIAGGTLRRVTSLASGTEFEQPVLSADGSRLSFVAGRALRRQHRDARPFVLDLDRGTVTDLLGDRETTAFDAVVSGDAQSVLVSSCDDLDPAVGNSDRNQELFAYDMSSGRFSQVTDTLGGACGSPFAPMVSTDGGVVAFALTGGGLGCRPPSTHQRDIASDFAFGAVRAIRPAADNRPPVLSGALDVVAAIGELISLELAAVDPDGDALVFFAQFAGEGELPGGASFTLLADDRASFLWGADYAQVGEHVLRVGVFDGRGGADTVSARLTVCRARLVADNLPVLISSLFDPLPAACGSADINGDGFASAADIVSALRTSASAR